MHFDFGGSPRQGGSSFEGLGGASDFFESLFGGIAAGPGEARGGERWSMRGQDQEAVGRVSLEEALSGAAKSLALETAELDDRDHVQRATRHYAVKIPPGTSQPARIRLSGQGLPRQGAGS
jgi:curved DNA-binding protein